jgi:hypothetical protein
MIRIPDPDPADQNQCGSGSATLLAEYGVHMQKFEPVTYGLGSHHLD